MGDAKLKITLGKPGEIAKVYYIDSGDDRIISVRHIEQEWSQTAQVVIQDSDATLSALDLIGWICYIGYGYGANYSECAPMDVITQTTPRVPGSITTSLRMAGVFDMMGLDEASEAYRPGDVLGDTVKTLLQATAGGWFTAFNHCKAYTLIFDSEDDIIDSFMPKDYFSIAPKESRLSVFKKLLAFTGCKARAEYTIGEYYGAIHIFVPTITGSYDYEYDDVVTGHNFFEKAVRKRLVIPNKIVVKSHPDHAPDISYSGSYVDDDSYNALERYIVGHRLLRVESNDQCDDIAEATIKNLRLAASRGSGFAPMNCGQEVMDYVNITDSWVGDSRAGNISYIKREYHNTGKPEDFSMEFGFGKTARGGLLRPAFEQTDLNTIMDYIDERFANLVWPEVVPKLHVERQLIIPVWIPGAPLVDTGVVTDIAATTATGNITINDLGVPDPTAYGICYNTTGDPYITATVPTDSQTDEGAVILTGEYTSDLTGLTAETKYYYRAYATNALGTGYGIQRIFTTLAA